VKDIKIGTFTIVDFTCHPSQPPNGKGMELITKEQCKMQVGTHKFALTKSYKFFLASYFCNSFVWFNNDISIN